MKSVYRIAIFCFLGLCLWPSSDVAAQGTRPNTVIILADDMERDELCPG